LTLVFYGLKNCDSCRAAVKMIRAAGIEADVRDVREDAVPTELLVGLIASHGIDRVINRASKTWRSLDERERAADPVTLLQTYPALMKRPLLILENGDSHLGWTQEVMALLGINKF